MISGIILIILIIVIISIIATAANSIKTEKNTTRKTESFEKMIRTVYFYLIMIILICVLIFGVIGFFNNLMNIYLPEKITQTAIEAEITQNNNIQGIITSSASIIVSVPIFIYFSKKTKKENKN